MSSGMLVCWRRDGTPKLVNIPTDVERWASMYQSAEDQAYRLMRERNMLLEALRDMLDGSPERECSARARAVIKKISTRAGS